MNLNLKDKKEIIFVFVFSCILIGYYINFNMNLGIYCSDIFLYLRNALYFTGTNIYSTYDIFLSPVICFLTSLLFRAGLVDRLAIYIVTGIFAILGNVGMYLLLRTRFDKLLSLTGAIVYSGLALSLTWLANGSLDVPSVAVTIWAIYFTIRAMDTPKYYVGAIVMFVISFFTRYNTGLILPVIVLCYIYHNSFKINRKDLKYMLIGLAIAAILSTIILVTVNTMSNGNLGFTDLLAGGAGGTLGSTKDAAYNTDLTYYIVNFPNFISSSSIVFVKHTPALENPTILSGLVLVIIAVGAVLWAKKCNFELNKEKIIGIILLLIALVTFNHFSSFITIIITFLGLLIIGKDSKNQGGLMMAGWLLANFIFFSYYVIKVNRYIIPAFPAFTYFLMVAVEEINERIPKKKILPIVLIVLFIVQGFAFTMTFEDTRYYMGPEEISDYIISNNDNYTDMIIGTYNMRPYHWYLGKNVTGIPNDRIGSIESASIDYYISHKELNLTNYTEETNIDGIYLYKRIIN